VWEEFAGKVAVVTGGSRGIGRAVALALAAAGARVVVGYQKDEASARATCDTARNAGGTAVCRQADVADSGQVNQLFEEAGRRFGLVDLLVNAAGSWPRAGIWELSDEQWKRTLAVNLDGAFYACRAASLTMKSRRSGKIVNVSSVAASRGARSGHADYAAAKGAVDALTKSVAHELAPFGINVNAVAPGVIRTDLVSDALREHESDYLAQIPLARIGEPEEVAQLILFLLSPKASYITGQIVHVNGGMLMP
jgi:3-oxoacyl-[acyl-carrier protein] reductase